MKKALIFFAVLSLTFSIIAQPPPGPANKGMCFGLKTTMAGAIEADQLINVLAIKPVQEIKVKGKVVEVCKAEGCWLKMHTASGPVMIKMKDHSFMVP